MGLPGAPLLQAGTPLRQLGGISGAFAQAAAPANYWIAVPRWLPQTGRGWAERAGGHKGTEMGTIGGVVREGRGEGAESVLDDRNLESLGSYKLN